MTYESICSRSITNTATEISPVLDSTLQSLPSRGGVCFPSMNLHWLGHLLWPKECRHCVTPQPWPPKAGSLHSCSLAEIIVERSPDLLEDEGVDMERSHVGPSGNSSCILTATVSLPVNLTVSVVRNCGCDALERLITQHEKT